MFSILCLNRDKPKSVANPSAILEVTAWYCPIGLSALDFSNVENCSLILVYLTVTYRLFAKSCNEYPISTAASLLTMLRYTLPLDATILDKSTFNDEQGFDIIKAVSHSHVIWRNSSTEIPHFDARAKL